MRARKIFVRPIGGHETVSPRGRLAKAMHGDPEMPG